MFVFTQSRLGPQQKIQEPSYNLSTTRLQNRIENPTLKRAGIFTNPSPLKTLLQQA